MTSKRWEPAANQWPEMKPTPPVLALHTSDAHTIARVIVTNALEWVSASMDCDKSQVVKCLNRGETAAHHEFKLGLARYLAEYLGFLDEDIKAVYVSDHVGDYGGELPEKPPRWLIHLVIFADPKTAALTSLISALHRALTAAVRESIDCAKTEGFLDVQLVNSADLENLARYAALLTAPSDRPTHIWQREPAGPSRRKQSALSANRNAVGTKS
jgi:hypothetical protein